MDNPYVFTSQPASQVPYHRSNLKKYKLRNPNFLRQNLGSVRTEVASTKLKIGQWDFDILRSLMIAILGGEQATSAAWVPRVQPVLVLREAIKINGLLRRQFEAPRSCKCGFQYVSGRLTNTRRVCHNQPRKVQNTWVKKKEELQANRNVAFRILHSPRAYRTLSVREKRVIWEVTAELRVGVQFMYGRLTNIASPRQKKSNWKVHELRCHLTPPCASFMRWVHETKDILIYIFLRIIHSLNYCQGPKAVCILIRSCLSHPAGVYRVF